MGTIVRICCLFARLFTPRATRCARQEWVMQMQAAVAANEEPEGELLESPFDEELEYVEWQW